MNKKLIAVDVDGTLVNSQKIITEKTKLCLKKAIKEGHKLIIVSGRQTEGLFELADELDLGASGGLLSAYNGGMIYDYGKKKVLVEHKLDKKLAEEILSFSKNLKLELMIPYGPYIITDKKDNPYAEREAKILNVKATVREDIYDKLDFSPNKILFAQDEDKIDGEVKKLKEKFGESTEQVKSARFYYELMPKGLSKGQSLLEAAEILKIPREDILAFGDEMNDLSMIEAAGTSVAMGNAIKLVKEKADFVTLSNDEDGIAYYLENYLLNKN